MRFIIALFFLPVMAFAQDRIDIAQYRTLSVMQLPNSQQAVVGVLGADGQAGFAVCDIVGTQFLDCRLNLAQRFSLEKMPIVQEKFERELRSGSTTPDVDAFEVGVLGALKLSNGQMAIYYGLKTARKAVLTEEAIRSLSRLFNSNPEAPLYVRFPADGDSVRILTALQFAASSH